MELPAFTGQLQRRICDDFSGIDSLYGIMDQLLGYIGSRTNIAIRMISDHVRSKAVIDGANLTVRGQFREDLEGYSATDL